MAASNLKETKTLSQCLAEKKAKDHGLCEKPKLLFDCANKDQCAHKLPFGYGAFCRQSPLYDQNRKTEQ